MLQGEVRCACGQVFGFATIMPTVACPKCGGQFNSAEHGTEVIEQPAEDLLTEEVQEEI